MSNLKPTNPKDAIGIRKLSFSVLPWRVLCGIALAMLEGAAKYGRHNYRAAGVRASVYFDAVVGRHLTDWWEGTDIDPESNLHHVDKAIAGLVVMRDSMLQGNFVDDRPPRGNLDMTELNRLASQILDRHADKKPRHYTIADTPPAVIEVHEDPIEVINLETRREQAQQDIIDQRPYWRPDWRRTENGTYGTEDWTRESGL